MPVADTTNITDTKKSSVSSGLDSDDELTENERQEQEKEYVEKDPIRKFQFHEYTETVCLTETDPGAFDDIEKEKQEKAKASEGISIAPGEGQIPTDILQEDGWLVKTFPQFFPDGENGLKEERDVKIRIQQWFEQKLLNYDERFADSASFLYAATQLLEKEQLQKNINYSFKRGTPGLTSSGNVTYTYLKRGI